MGLLRDKLRVGLAPANSCHVLLVVLLRTKNPSCGEEGGRQRQGERGDGSRAGGAAAGVGAGAVAAATEAGGGVTKLNPRRVTE